MPATVCTSYSTASQFRKCPHNRDLKGWNSAAIAVFHESKAALELLLKYGADPYLKSSYNKSAWDMAQDDFDAAKRVVRSRYGIIEHVATVVYSLVLSYPVFSFLPAAETRA